MSKKALCVLLTFIMTTSLLFSSALTAFGESLSQEEDIAAEQADDEQALMTASEDASAEEDPSSSVTTEPVTVSLAQHPVLTVSAISNYFGRIDAEYNEFTREITVTYLLKASRRLLSVYWTLTYDPKLLTVDPQKNTAQTVCPIMKDSSVMSIDAEKGTVVFSATSLKMYDFTTSEADFVQIVFDVPQLTPEDSEITKVDLSVDDLVVSEPNPQTGESYDGKEIVLVANSKAKKTDVQVSKYTTITPSTYTDPNSNPATPDAPVTTVPPTTVKPTAAPTEPVPASTAPAEKNGGAEKSDSLDRISTGPWYIAALILLILLVCSIILFIMRKRDIYNN